VLLADRLGPVCAPALMEGRKRLRISDLRHHRLLHAETRTQAWSDWAHAQGVTIDLADSQGFEHTYFMLEAAASGLGVGIASYALVEYDLKSGRLVAPFGFAPSGRSYCVLHARQAANNAKIAAFRSWIISAACSDRASGEGKKNDPDPPERGVT
jgi:LysR family glycine cleavage system transcriptional activator